ncbi:flagellar basal body P-ring formation chaperone FlgA [Rhodovulum sp. DZ06]|uniref:flagellar basal body P-ring formation chaperone FlgA n=1 Tax=Rhodovulum sp. DZ06 TaxID=3425126 RepID=UPI003D33FD64
MTAVLAALLLAAPAAAAQQSSAESGFVTPSRVIRAGERIALDDLSRRPGPAQGVAEETAIAGLEARITLFPGRPIAAGDLSPPAMVERNQIVTLRFSRGPLTIEAEGRALDRGAEGDRVRVMNLVSRASVVGRVSGPELVEVGR